MARLCTLKDPRYLYGRRGVGTPNERLAIQWAIDFGSKRVLRKRAGIGSTWADVPRSTMKEHLRELSGEALYAYLLEHGAQPGKPPASLPRCPDLETLARWSFDGIAEAVDGCRIEPDGTCQHGSKSWCLISGVM